MSTSLEISPKASPSNKETLFDPARLARALGAVLGAAAVAAFIALHIPDFKERRAADLAAAPLIEQAKLWPMTYETAEAGKPVVWCVDHPSAGVTYLNGRPDQVLVFSNEYPVMQNVGDSGGRCAKVLAVVEGRKPRGLVLRFVQAL